MKNLLSKGEDISLVIAHSKILVGLGWDKVDEGLNFDLDASVFLLTEDEKVRGQHDLIFYNQLKSIDGAVVHTGDNRNGVGDGDDESVKIDLSLVSQEIQKMVVVVTIHEAERRKQHFGLVKNSFIRIVDLVTNKEILRFDLVERTNADTAMVFGEIFRDGTDWRFLAVGQGYAGGLMAMCKQYGVSL